MSFVTIVAFCTAMSAGPNTPVPPMHCVWVEPEERYETLLECAELADWTANRQDVTQEAQMTLFEQHGYQGPVQWYTWCIQEDDLRNFYTHFGVTDLGDIPEEA